MSTKYLGYSFLGTIISVKCDINKNIFLLHFVLPHVKNVKTKQEIMTWTKQSVSHVVDLYFSYILMIPATGCYSMRFVSI